MGQTMLYNNRCEQQQQNKSNISINQKQQQNPNQKKNVVNWNAKCICPFQSLTQLATLRKSLQKQMNYLQNPKNQLKTKANCITKSSMVINKWQKKWYINQNNLLCWHNGLKCICVGVQCVCHKRSYLLRASAGLYNNRCN